MTIAQALVITLLAICAATSEAVRLPLRIPTKAAFDSEIALVSRGANSIVAEQCRPNRFQEQFAPRTAGLLPQSEQLLACPSCCANALCSRKQVCNSPFSIRQGRIVTTASQQLPDRHQCDRGSEPRLTFAEISSCANQRRGSAPWVPAHSRAISRNPSSFAAANHLPLSPRISIRSRSIRRRSRSGYCRASAR